MRDIQWRLQCRKCGALGELILTLPQTVIDDKRRTRNPTSPMEQIEPPQWRGWD